MFTIEEFERRFKPLEEHEKTKALAALDDANIIISAEFLSRGKRMSEADDELVKTVIISMAKRAFGGSDFGGAAITQYSQSASPYSESVTFANPQGDIYLTKSEKRLLGLNTQRVFSISPKIEVNYANDNTHG